MREASVKRQGAARAVIQRRNPPRPLAVQDSIQVKDAPGHHGCQHRTLRQLCDKAQLQPAYVRTLFKTVGICFLTDFAADVCRDVEETGLAQRVETVGRMLILAVAAPVLASLLGKLLELAP